jgi:hypothetical protein
MLYFNGMNRGGKGIEILQNIIKKFAISKKDHTFDQLVKPFI